MLNKKEVELLRKAYQKTEFQALKRENEQLKKVVKKLQQQNTKLVEQSKSVKAKANKYAKANKQKAIRIEKLKINIKNLKAKDIKLQKINDLHKDIGPLIAGLSQGLRTSIMNVFEEIGDEECGIEGYTGKDVLIHYIKTWGTTPLKHDWIGWYFQEAVGYQEEKDEYQTDAGTAKQMMAGWRDAVKWDIEQKKKKAEKAAAEKIAQSA